MRRMRTAIAIAAGTGVIVAALAALAAWAAQVPQAAGGTEKIVMPDNQKTDYVVLGMGCFWGAEKRMGEIPGVIDVESGYAGGERTGIGYHDILDHEKALRAGNTTTRNHAEVVKVTFDPLRVPLEI